MNKKEINSVEIAKLAGVSRSTVSRVINNYANVPDTTREKVMKVIEDYNYFPNLSAQVLAGKQQKVIGLFLIGSGDISGDILTNLLISRVIDSASTLGYYVLTYIIKEKDALTIRKVKEVFYQSRIEGGLFIGANNEEPFIEELIADGFIIGIVDQDLPDKKEVNRIVYSFDNFSGAVQAVDYLVGLDHQHIGMIMGDMDRSAGPQKYEGFLHGLRKHGLVVRPSWILPGDFHEKSGYQAIQRLLQENEELPTAIFAVNDSVAFGAMRALQEHAIKIPEEISIIGFDDHMLSAYAQPALTTLRVDFMDMMNKLTSQLIDVIEHGSSKAIKVVVGVQIIERASCRQRSN